MNFIKTLLRSAILQAERFLDRLFGAADNPLTHLGALGWLLFWIVTVSGIYVYAFFDTGVTQAYASLEALAKNQPWLGGLMRSLHRYASDALVVVALVHMLREFAFDRLRGNRWFSWLTGVVVLVFVYLCGITGYWLVWDQLSQYVAIITSEWLDSLGVFAEPIARNFLSATHLNGRFFTLMVYIHIAVPLIMLLLMWIHIQRQAHARVTPSRQLGMATTGALLVLAIVVPAVSQAPADLDRMPFMVGLDWFYLALYPLTDVMSGGTLWALTGAALLSLAALPWLPPLRKPAPAVVHLNNCNGCARCFADCPFGAITMVKRSDQLPYEQEASVDADQCMSCGICVGACPTATPFRRASALEPGIELMQQPIAQLRDDVLACAGRLRGEARVLVFACGHCGSVDTLAGPAVGVLKMPCVGMLPPPFIDFVLSRGHADGVFVAACAADACYERLGDRWTLARLSATRDPQMRARVPRERVALCRESAADGRRRQEALARFQQQLRGLGVMQKQATPGTAVSSAIPWMHPVRAWPVSLRIAGQAAAYAALIAAIGIFATGPGYAWLGRDEATVKVSFSHAGRPLKDCRRYTPEELARLPFEKRSATNCERGRWPVYLEVDVDGRPYYRGQHAPAGLWSDGPSSVYVRNAIPAGVHRFEARMRDSGRQQGYDYSGAATVTLSPGMNFVIDFRSTDGGFSFGPVRAGGSR
jgi:ferredoxin